MPFIFYIYKLIFLIFTVAKTLIVIRVVISWLAPYSRNEFTNLVYVLTEPMLSPFRRMLPRGSRLDFSPILAYIALNIIQRAIFYLI